MIYTYNSRDINTNLGGDCYEKLSNGEWKIGFLSDNEGLDDKNNDNFYKDYKNRDNENARAFKNKVSVRLVDGNTVEKHIIHWCPSDNYFCISEDTFWDQFE